MLFYIFPINYLYNKFSAKKINKTKRT